MEPRTGLEATRHVLWHAPPLQKSQDVSVSTAKTNPEGWCGHSGRLQRTNFPRTQYPSSPMSEDIRCDERNITDSMPHPDRPHRTNGFPKTPYPAVTSTTTAQASLHAERDIPNTTTSPPSSTTTTPANGPPHTNPPFPHAHPPLPAPSSYSIPQTFFAYPPIDPFDQSLKRHPNYYYYSTHNLSQEVEPENGSRGVRLRHPDHLLERRRQKLGFAPTALVYEYGQEGQRDMPMRPAGTKFHDDGGDGDEGSILAGPWPRYWFSGRMNVLDLKFLGQAHDPVAGRKKVWYDSVKKDYVWTTLEEAKDMSGREERMREKAMARRRCDPEADTEMVEGEVGSWEEG
ncbi:hypothetical protein HO173_006734 [Letharia columbiana]|uniref:Uncharacterized protein n=1 Tax=Letharia columbiana TaxID=112416 RepID=A0A8H6FUT2_9LECA|nr:uncharacterized protein HO173_006734 [Letharia columbiana]KAF6235107.1 hypothetical protein HO173_006734 [Letharia columbiana]